LKNALEAGRQSSRTAAAPGGWGWYMGDPFRVLRGCICYPQPAPDEFTATVQRSAAS